MKRPERVLLVGRHFWPHGAIDSAGHLMELATGLHSIGLHVEVVTPKHATAWPERFYFREFLIHRPVRMFKQGWTARGDRTPSRYIRLLRDWIVDYPASIDAIVCDGTREESIAAVEAARGRNVPVVLRLAGHGESSDLDFFQQTRMGQRCRVNAAAADAVVVDQASSHRRWLALGGDPQKTHRIANGFGATIESGPKLRQRLRRSMARINGDLFVPDTSTVVLSVERMRRDSGVMHLVQSAYALSQHIRGLQFWLVGDGPARDTIFSRMRGDGLRQMTSMPGSFALMDDVFVAADLLVHAGGEGFEHQIPTAIVTSLPIVVANTPAAREYFSATVQQVNSRLMTRRPTAVASQQRPDDHQTMRTTAESAEPCDLVWWFDPERPKTLRFALEQIVADPPAARQRAEQLRRLLQRRSPRSAALQKYRDLIRQLADARTTDSRTKRAGTAG
ncbi:glycosyltransferase family 4 protein [Roseiconus nitratireducens]|uniref:Glycosyltransferase family 4 protein n=1 Tax=Roseiconus nitratireducens TaxID=2605748 RepID=A0A5M6CYG4_9BACT|nr:glycosyltransferase [Roseiconus nitratireducens]KAA5540267.1 glycosyltransferase family 4 protein [Roseiconus nitratireducens]